MVIYFHKAGQLANRLFAASHLLANAKENDYQLLLLSLNEYASFYKGIKNRKMLGAFAYAVSVALFKFCIKAKIKESFFHQIIIAEIPEFSFGEKVTYHWDAKDYYDLRSAEFLEAAKKKPITILFGRFFRDYQAIEDQKDVVRKFFTPTNRITNEVGIFLSGLRGKDCVLVGVHIRKGDYRYFKSGKYNYSIEQYMGILNSIFHSVFREKAVYVICSNEHVDINTLEMPYKIYKHEGTPQEDLYCLSCCDYIIGPPSTFSLWASFLKSVPLYHIRNTEREIQVEDFAVPSSKEAYEFMIE